MVWKYKSSFDIQDYQGFVYKILHKPTGKYYIGKKTFWSKSRKKPLKGKKRSRVSFIESDWKTYWGSSKNFTGFVSKNNKKDFTRTILHLCKTKSEMSYKELIEQINHDVLNDDNSFNGWISVKLYRTE